VEASEFERINDSSKTFFTDFERGAQQSIAKWMEHTSSLGKAFDNMLRQIGISILSAIVEAAAMAVILFAIEQIPIVGPTVVSLIGAGSLATFATMLGSVGGKAEGGALSAPGGPKADSRLFYGSDGEFVIQEHAARQYYGHDVMHAINEERIPREALTHAIAGHALGGPVMVAASSYPSFAFGGAVGGGGGGDVDVNVAGPTTHVLFGPHEVERLQATTQYQRGWFNQAAKDAVRVTRLVTRSSGHRGEQ
jgi:hypothetical protein